MSEIGKLRQAVYNLATDDVVRRTDEEWYDRLWELLDPVIDTRAERALATAQAVMPDWTSDDDDDDDDDDQQLHVHDAGEYRDPNTGEVDVEAHRLSFEGSTSQLAQHLIDNHNVPAGALAQWRNGLTQGDWTSLDIIHRAAHEA